MAATIYGGTGSIYVTGAENYIIPTDVTSVYSSVVALGSCTKSMYSRATDSTTDTSAWCYTTQYTDMDRTIEINVNASAWTAEPSAQAKAQEYAEAIGRLPKFLRKDVDTITIQDGVYGFGGGNRDLLIHTGQGDAYIAAGNLDETLLHEACHTSLDSYVYGTDAWNTAVATDDKYVTDYARDNPQREDIAESFLFWFATRFRKTLFTAQELTDWESDMGGRFAYFDDLCQDMGPNYSVLDDSLCSALEPELTGSVLNFSTYLTCLAVAIAMLAF